MTSSLKIDASLDTHGFFWYATDSDAKFPAHLARGPKRIELTAAAKPIGFKDFATLFAGASDDRKAPIGTEAKPVIHGTTSYGACSLFGLSSLPTGAHLGEDGTGFATDSLGISLCLFGLSLESDTCETLSSAAVTFRGLNGWVVGKRQLIRREHALSLIFPTSEPMVDMTVLSDRTRFVVENFYRHRPRRFRESIKNELCIEIEPSRPRSLAWFMNAASRIESFLSACVGSSVRVRTLAVTNIGDETGWIVRSRILKAAKPDLQLWIRSDPSELARALASWFSSGESMEPFERLIYGTLRSGSLFVETEFLALAQGIESFHRLTSTRATVIDTNSFRNVREVVSAAIDGLCADPIASRLKEAIHFANEPSLQDRIDDLFGRLPRDLLSKIVGDPNEFARRLRQTRNFLTHVGTKRGKSVVAEPAELFLMNQKLHALLRFLVLVHWGFPPSVAFEPVYHQSRRWRIL